MAATYLYAIIPTRESIIFDVTGLDRAHNNGQDSQVYSIPFGVLAAVVSPSPRENFRGLNRDEAARYLVAHQRVVELLMQDFPVLPVKFGTVLPDESQVRQLLRLGEGLFQHALQRLEGRLQIEVVVLWNLQYVFQEIARETQIARFKAQIEGLPPEKTQAERVAIGQLVMASLERRRMQLRDFFLPAFSEIAPDLVVNPLMDDSMVINVALLLDEAGRLSLIQRLEALDAEFEGDQHRSLVSSPLNFRCVGPMPPYSFSTVEVQMPPFDQVDRARKLLGLAETVEPGEIKRAYHRLAGRLHPDHNPDNVQAEAEMAELSQAYELLSLFARCQSFLWDCKDTRRIPANPKDPSASNQARPAVQLNRPMVEKTMLIGIRRQEITV